MSTLIARWTVEQDPISEEPERVFWGDGRAATLGDYRRHYDDTHELVFMEDGFERRMFPWLTADVRFDAYSRNWFLLRPGAVPITLGITDPNASDPEIRSELYDLPRVWKARIWRGYQYRWSNGGDPEFTEGSPESGECR